MPMSSAPYLRLYERLAGLPWTAFALDGGTGGTAAFPYRLVGTLGGRSVEIAADPDPRAGSERWSVALLRQDGAPEYRTLEDDAAVEAMLRALPPAGRTV